MFWIWKLIKKCWDYWQFGFSTPSKLVYEYIVPKNHARADIFALLSNSITHQLIVLESCSNPQKTWQVFKSAMKKKFLGFGFFVSSDIIVRKAFGHFGSYYLAWGPTTKWKYFAQVLIGN